MLSKQYRLPATIRFTGSRTIRAPLFVMKVLPNNLSYSRFGFIVPKRVDKRAVIRNRTKRVLRSIIEEKLTQIRPGYDMLFLVQKNIGDTREQAQTLLHSVLQTQGLLR